MNVLTQMMEDAGLAGMPAADLVGEDLDMLLPSTVSSDDDATTAAPDDEDRRREDEEEEEGEDDADADGDGDDTNYVMSFNMSGAEDAQDMKAVFTKNSVSSALEAEGLPECDFVQYVEPADEGGLDPDSLLLNNMFVTGLALGSLVALILLFNMKNMCMGGDDEAGDKKALMDTEQANNYGA